MKEDNNATSQVRNPNALFQLPMSTRSDAPAPTADASPQPPSATLAPASGDGAASDNRESGGEPSSPTSSFPLPKLRLEVREMMHPGAHRFLSRVDASALLPVAVANVQRILYSKPADRTTNLPPTRSVTLILRDMDGVAYTTGSELDPDHKEIHFSLDYIAGVRDHPKSTDSDSNGKESDENKTGSLPAAGGRGDDAVAHEIVGVITHELVHCYQWDARGTCPGGLIEGIADFVRLQCGLSPPHWRRDLNGSWDRGYQDTAYFLEYLEGRFGDGTVRRINEALRAREYEEKAFWTENVGRPVEQLWQDYVKACKCEE